MTHRLVVVSNRVPTPATEGIGPGGLVSALLPSLEAMGSAVWFGWSGETSDDFPCAPHREMARGVEYATIDLTERQVSGYYEEFGNRVLWPLFHGLVDHVAPEAAREYDVYREVNERFARALRPLLRPDDLVWVHDYHLIPLGAELRRLGWRGRTGYFHHTPIPAVEIWSQLPHGEVLAGHMSAYDLIGVQTERDRLHLEDILLDEDAARRVASYPISIDPERLRDFTDSASATTGRVLDRTDEPLIYFGVERLDYTKGIPERLRAFERALEESPEMRTGARFIQWSAPSRTAVPEYQAEREAVEAAARHLNNRFEGYEPLEIDFEAHPPEVVAPALQQADVCVVSSVADGMNLVAKEFAAVHSEEHPGVLVISDTCGASEELTEALIYPAGDTAAMAEALQEAYFMPDAERRRRAGRLREIVDQHTSRDWMREFVNDLREVLPRTRALMPSAAQVRTPATTSV